jgi:serine/threonine protein kinase/formylglycine-generating enzyme required for sulfatase activity
MSAARDEDPGQTIKTDPNDHFGPSGPPAAFSTFFQQDLAPISESEATIATGEAAGGLVVSESRAGYEIIEEVGRGGMGVVYRARQTNLFRDVAVKRMKGGPGSSARQASFAVEAMVTGGLDHPNIVPVHDLGVNASGEAFIAMKLVGGRSWKQLLHPQSSSDREIAPEFDRRRHLEILLSVCNAVAFAHSREVIHCDLKPENVMVGEFGEVLVMDWGVAVSCADEAEGAPSAARNRRAVRGPCGTPAYMAPELAEGRGQDIDQRTDVYLLGAILYEILEGRAPHRGPSVDAVLEVVREGAQRSYASGTPRELIEICERGMAQKAEDRFPSVLALRDALRGYLEHEESLTITRVAEEKLLAVEQGEIEQGVRREDERPRIYGDLSESLAGFRQARVLWPENEAARVGEQRSRVVFARAAIAAGDYALAITQLEDAAEDPEIESLRDRARRAVEERERASRTARRQRRALAAAALVIVAGLAIGFLLVNEQRRRADENAEEARRAESLASRNAAQADRNAKRAEENAERAKENAERAENNAERAEKNAERWKAALDDVQRLSDSRLLQALIEEVPLLYPPEPSILDGIDRWIDRADEVLEREPLHRKALEKLTARQRDYTEDDFRRDYAQEFGQIEDLEEQLVEVRRLATEGPDERARRIFSENIKVIEDRIAGLRERVKTPRQLKFADFQDTWQYMLLATHLSDLQRFRSETGAYEEAKRLRSFAESLKAKTVDAHRESWERVARAVAADPRFRGIELKPQPGLVPLGPDPESKLEEFLHLFTHEGELPERDASGRLELRENCGVILVLVPGGELSMGAQKDDPDAANYDPLAISELESPVQRVRLDAFLISKYEMTQAQWIRGARENPSQYAIGREPAGIRVTGLHPVEGMSWQAARDLCARLGLELPTEAQWEWAARAGTTTPWYCGADRKGLVGHLNIADASAARAGARWPEIKDWPELDDGFPFHAPVNGRRPNPWGLHDVLSNVRELTSEKFAPYFVTRVDGRGHLAVPLSEAVVTRGGGFRDTVREARIAFREIVSPKDYNDDYGLRPARRLDWKR